MMIDAPKAIETLPIAIGTPPQGCSHGGSASKTGWGRGGIMIYRTYNRKCFFLLIIFSIFIEGKVFSQYGVSDIFKKTPFGEEKIEFSFWPYCVVQPDTVIYAPSLDVKYLPKCITENFSQYKNLEFLGIYLHEKKYSKYGYDLTNKEDSIN